jgi:hypothetical protein
VRIAVGVLVGGCLIVAAVMLGPACDEGGCDPATFVNRCGSCLPGENRCGGWIESCDPRTRRIDRVHCDPLPRDADADADAGFDADPDACTWDRRCHVDFPCRDESFCRDEHTLVRCDSVHCSSPRACGTTCCSGAACLESIDSPIACPQGEWCFENPGGGFWGFGSGRSALCLPDPDGDAGTDADADNRGYSRPDVFEPWCRQGSGGK